MTAVSTHGQLLHHQAPGPFSALVDDAVEALDASDSATCAQRCLAALPWVEALGDRSTARYLRYVGALALVELAELQRAGELLAPLLDGAGDAGPQDPLWRAKALALDAEAAFTAGRPARAVEHLAEALDLLDLSTSLHVNRLSATLACGLALQAAGAHPEAEHLLRTVLADVRTTDGVGELNVLPELAVLVAERAAGADLRGDRAEAALQWRRALELALRWRRRGEEEGEPTHVVRSTAAEALAWQRLGLRDTASAAAGADLLSDVCAGALTGRVEAVMARLHLAGEAEHRGDLARAAEHLDEALAQTLRTEPGVWAFTVLATRAELDAAGRRALEGERPDRWRDLARTLLVRTAAGSRALVSEVEALRQARRAARARDSAAAAVLTDPLTGVVNRRGLDELLVRAAREGRSPSACFVDVDRFKAVNDGFSHAVGDEVLRRVAELLSASGEACGAAVARYGGDEFVLVSVAGDDLETLGQRLVEAVAQHPWEVVAPGLAVTVSVGVTGPLPARDVLAASDAAMLSAKRAGRSRAVVSPAV